MKSGDKLTVDQDCITQGKRRDICACPVSLAFKKAGYVRAYVSSHDVALEDAGGNYYLAHLATRAQDFIHVFDDEGESGVYPFDFEVLLEQIEYCPFGRTIRGAPAIRTFGAGETTPLSDDDIYPA